MSESPKFLQGIFRFEGRGLDKPSSFNPKLVYTIPADKRIRPIYLRAGNSSSDLAYLVLLGNDKPLRYCPIGAKGAMDVGLHVIEEVKGGTALEVCYAAPEGVQGTLIVDVGLSES